MKIKILENIKLKPSVTDMYWLDNDTFVVYFSYIPKEIIAKYNLIKSDSLYAEYHEDENKYYYIVECEDDSIDVTDMIDKSVNNYIYELSQKF